MDFRVAGNEDMQTILAFEEGLVAETKKDDIERRLMLWSSSSREESLNFYLPLGWSFVAVDKKRREVCGYFLAQPILFFRAMTQTLWVEESGFREESVGIELGKIAIGIARDKHFQRVLINPLSRLAQIENFRNSLNSIEVLQLKLTKDNSDA